MATLLTEDEVEIILQYEEEQSRLGNFERIFPLASNAAFYSKFFEHIRPANELLMKYLRICSRTPKEYERESPPIRKKNTR
jgi:hypothetical protein